MERSMTMNVHWKDDSSDNEDESIMPSDWESYDSHSLLSILV
jgi:hypothetical protein